MEKSSGKGFVKEVPLEVSPRQLKVLFYNINLLKKII